MHSTDPWPTGYRGTNDCDASHNSRIYCSRLLQPRQFSHFLSSDRLRSENFTWMQRSSMHQSMRWMINLIHFQYKKKMKEHNWEEHSKIAQKILLSIMRQVGSVNFQHKYLRKALNFILKKAWKSISIAYEKSSLQSHLDSIILNLKFNSFVKNKEIQRVSLTRIKQVHFNHKTEKIATIPNLLFGLIEKLCDRVRQFNESSLLINLSILDGENK